MRCKEAKILFSFYMDNELSEDKTNDLKKHLADCSVCCQEIQQIQTTTRFMQTVLTAQKVPAISADFDRKFYRRIEKRAFVWEWPSFYPVRLAMARLAMCGAVAAMIFIGIMIIYTEDKTVSYGQKDLSLIAKQTMVAAEEIEQKEILDNQAREILEYIL